MRPGLAGPALSALAMACVLVGLGVWQLRRLHWKQGILHAIDQAERAPPVPLPDRPRPFRKVSVEGRFRPGPYLIYGADVRDTPAGPRLGGQLIQPLFRPAGPPVLVDRGWVADGTAVPPPAAAQRVQGYVRLPETPGPFTPRDDAAAHRVYTLAPSSMAAALGLAQAAPYTLVQLGAPQAAGLPQPAAALPRPPNDHLSYALTWFGLAAVLVAVFALWLRRALAHPPA